jgi:hypothetical protein
MVPRIAVRTVARGVDLQGEKETLFPDGQGL